MLQPQPSPPQTDIVRSIYLRRGIRNYVEIGWKWNRHPDMATPQRAGTLDAEPTVFLVRWLRGQYRIFEGPHGDGSGNQDNPGWGTLTPGPDTYVTFQIIRDDGTGTVPRYRFERDGMLVGYLRQPVMPKGHVLVGTEAFAMCDSLSANARDLQKALPSDGGLVWTDWSDVRNQRGIDRSKWWYFLDDLSVPQNVFRTGHCLTTEPFCPDRQGYFS